MEKVKAILKIWIPNRDEPVVFEDELMLSDSPTPEEERDVILIISGNMNRGVRSIYGIEDKAQQVEIIS